MLNKVFWWDPQKNNVLTAFCVESSLHGLKYIGQQNRHFCERLFWAAAFTLSLAFATFCIFRNWKKFRDSPTVTIFAPVVTNLNDIPFPALTICNVNYIQKDFGEEIVREMKEAAPENEFKVYEKFFHLGSICFGAQSFSFLNNYTTIERVEMKYRQKMKQHNIDRKTSNSSLKMDTTNFLRMGAQPCSDMIRLCSWAGAIYNCSELFQPIETDYGLCCTFNAMPKSLLMEIPGESSKEPFLEEWKTANLSLDDYKFAKEFTAVFTDDKGGKLEPKLGRFPRRQLRSGKSFGLSVLLDPGLKQYYCTNTDSLGFQILADLPFTIPVIKNYGTPVEPNTETFVKVLPNINTASTNIKNLPLNKRLCYFNGEFKLKFRKYYSESNCIQECLGDIIFDLCKCWLYFMPRPEKSENNICGLAEISCIQFSNSYVSQKGIFEYCNHCLPLCNDIQYSLAADGVPLENREKIWKHPNGKMAEWSKNNVSVLHVYFAVDSVYTKKRKQLYSFNDLLSNIGGILSLCLGFSLMSFIEIIYFFSLRLVCQQKKIADQHAERKKHSHLLGYFLGDFKHVQEKFKDRDKVMTVMSDNYSHRF